MSSSRSTRSSEVPTLDELRARRDGILRIAQAHDATNVRVFGSVTRGESRPDRDIDLIVDLLQDAVLRRLKTVTDACSRRSGSL